MEGQLGGNIMRQTLTTLFGIIILMVSATSFAGDCGDVNNSGSLNILDVGYIISYLYKSGPPPDCGTVTDIDGNIYQTVTIGTQVWMVENLKVTHYRNGDAIPNETDNTTWAGLSTGAYCNYNNDEGYVGTYGRLYNGFAVLDGRNIAPAGWHVPTDAEWKQLEMYLGMSQTEADASSRWRGTDEGGKIKEAGTTHWNSPNTGATNESGFTALPGGYRTVIGGYTSMVSSAYFWSSTEPTSGMAWNRYVNLANAGIHRSYLSEIGGFSVRCVKD